jgi:hypothetical protein
LTACGREVAFAAPAAASPRDVVMAADAASTHSPLVKRLRMVIPFLWFAGPGTFSVAWAVKLGPAAAGYDVMCLLLFVIPPCQPVTDTIPWVVTRLLVAVAPSGLVSSVLTRHT